MLFFTSCIQINLPGRQSSTRGERMGRKRRGTHQTRRGMRVLRVAGEVERGGLVVMVHYKEEGFSRVTDSQRLLLYGETLLVRLNLED